MAQDIETALDERGEQPLLGSNYKTKKKLYNKNEVIYYHEPPIVNIKPNYEVSFM